MNSTIHEIPFKDIPQFSEKDIAYQSGDERYNGFFKYAPTIEVFPEVIEARKKVQTNRSALSEVLHDQYRSTDFHHHVRDRIDSLLDENTFTITTAHQPVLLLGPLYFVYKIISTIRLCRDLGDRYPEYKFQPIFVSGGEDHDFDEIATVHLFNKHYSWITSQSGSVGRMSLDGLKETLDQVVEVFGSSPFAKELESIIRTSYNSASTYADFNFQLVNRLFADKGLIVVNMDEPKFKEIFLPYALREIEEKSSAKKVRETQRALEERGIREQAHVRDINLFIIGDSSRYRIVRDGRSYHVGDESYSHEGLLNNIKMEPKNISPNVVMRPIFQELILPNLAYIGGGGEIAYWLERLSQFEAFGLPFPMLIRRNSALLIPRNVTKNAIKLGFNSMDFLDTKEDLTKKYLALHTDDDYTLEQEINELQNLFKKLADKAKKVDPTLEKFTLAEGAKQEKSIKNISSRITKAAKQKNDVSLNKISKLKDKIFPSGKLQERYDSFIPYYLRYGSGWFDHLIEVLDPMNPNFLLIEES